MIRPAPPSRRTLITLRQRPLRPGAISARSMGERIDIRPAPQIELGPDRQELETGAGEAFSAFAPEHGVEFLPKRVQMQHVARGIVELLLGELRRPPIRGLLLLRQLNAEQFLA